VETQREPKDGTRPAVRYVCMPGSPYTGSTLLGFLLDLHPECVSIGAATGLTARVDVATYVCSCGERFEECDFWSKVAVLTADLGYPVDVYQSHFWTTHVRMSHRRWLNGLLVRSLGHHLLTDARDAALARTGPIQDRLTSARDDTWSLATAVLAITGERVFIDTARDHQRPKYLAPSPLFDLKVLHLVRDPRGNVSSIMNHTGVDVRKAARQWVHYNREADRVRRYVAPDAWMRVHYRELCNQPQEVLDRIARFIGIDPAPLPADLQTGEHHVIGNSMRLHGVNEIRLDDAWRERLSSDDLEVIADVAGATSLRLGFDWP
jgi:hypothetical protein